MLLTSLDLIDDNLVRDLCLEYALLVPVVFLICAVGGVEISRYRRMALLAIAGVCGAIFALSHVTPEFLTVTLPTITEQALDYVNDWYLRYGPTCGLILYVGFYVYVYAL